MSFVLAPSVPIDWAPEVEALVAPFRGATIEIYDPKHSTLDAPYNPLTDLGGVETPTVVWPLPGKTCVARILRKQPAENLRATDEWGVRVPYQFDIALDPACPDINRGYRIKVTNGGNSPGLTNITFTVISAINSSYSNQLTILAISEEGPIA